MEEEVPGNGGWAKDGEAEEPARVAGESAAGRKGTRRSEKAKVSEEAALIDVRLDVGSFPRRLWRVVGWVGFLSDVIGGVESGLWEGYPASTLVHGVCV